MEEVDHGYNVNLCASNDTVKNTLIKFSDVQ